MKHLQDSVEHGRGHVEMALNPTFSRDFEPRDTTHHVENQGFLSTEQKHRPQSNYVQRITMLLICILFGGLLIILSVSSATLNEVKNLKFPSTVTTVYPSLGLPGYEGYSWNDVVTQAYGQDVNMMINAGLTSKHYYWIVNYLAPKMAADYNINVKFVNNNPCPITGATGMCSTPDIVTAIKTKVANSKDMTAGPYDIVWINGLNFYNMKTNNLLYGPFADKIPSTVNFDFESDTLKYDFKTPTTGYEMPYGFAYNTFIYATGTAAAAALLDSTDVDSVFKIATWIKTTNGSLKFTYGAPAKMSGTTVVEDNYDGAAFLKQAFYEVGKAGSDANFCSTYFSSNLANCQALKYSYDDFTETDFTTIPAKYTAIAPFLFSFLRQIEPNLYADTTGTSNYGGKTKNYPTSLTPISGAANAADLTTKFKAETIWLMNTYSATAPSDLTNSVGTNIAQGYTLATGDLANSNYFAIPINAKNKLAALVVIDYVSSAAAMFQRKSGTLNNPSALKGWTQYQAYDPSADEFTYKGENWKVAFDTVPNSKNCATLDNLRSSKIPEPPVAYISQLEIDWYWCVMNYGDANTPTSVSARCG